MIRKLLALIIALAPAIASAQVVNWGDFTDANQTVYVYFNTVGTDGVAEALTSGALEIYEDGSATQITTAETLTASFDSIVGLNQVAIDLTDAGFEAGKTYTVILTAGTVDSVSVVGRIVGTFSIERTPKVNVAQWLGTAAATPTVAGVPEVDTTHVNGSAAALGTAQTGDVYGLLTGNRSEPGQGAPAANAPPITKLDYLYKFLRNKKTQTGSLLSWFADDGTTVDHKATVSDASGTTTVEEVVTGP